MTEDRCNETPPGMHPNMVRPVGATWHKCRLAAGHDGLHLNNDGMTWAPKC